MMLTVAENQRRYRVRKAAKMQRYEAALREIAEHPVAAYELRTIAEKALAG